jgi:hypothetical protein
MNLVQKLIREYAHCEHEASIYQAHSQPVPAHIQRRIIDIEAWARVNVHPAHLQAAIQEKDHYVAHLKQEHIKLETAHNNQLKQATLEKAVGRVTQGMLGQDKLTPQQLRAIVTKQPLRARIPRQQQLTQAQRDEQTRNATKMYDPAGKGWTEKQFFKRMDDLADANEAEFAKLVRGYGVDPTHVRKFANDWKSQRVEFALKQRMADRHGDDTPGPLLDKVDDRDHRRAVLATAMLADAGEQAERGDSSNLDGFIEETPTPLLEESGRRGDVARAFEQLEFRGES